MVQNLKRCDLKEVLTKLLKTLLRPWISEFLHMVWRMTCWSERSHGISIAVTCLPSVLPPTPIMDNVGYPCLVLGILKFHEHYLGDNTVENSSDFQAGSSATLPTATSSAVEQHIASVREALGVESYYSRQVIERSQSRLQRPSQRCLFALFFLL